MLKEVERYDYVEESAEISVPAWRALNPRRPRKPGPTLPVGTRMSQQVSCVPLQSYLQVRFSHLGGGSKVARELRAENQNRFNIAVARGNSPLSRTSGDWHPITPAEIAAIKAAEEAAAQNSTRPRKVR